MINRNLTALIVAACVTTLVASRAFAFPETIRYGYTSCTQCHASPTGGGALNSFGRGFAQSFMSKWGADGEGKFAHGKVDLPESVMIGGDVRIVGLRRNNGLVTQDKLMAMQADFEAVWKPIEQLTVAGSMGKYQTQIQSQRHYVMYQPTDSWSLRVGKFMPAFGLNVPDHAIATKRWLGWNEGSSTYRAEGAWLGEKGEVIITSTLRQNSAGGEEEEEEEEEGASLRRVAAEAEEEELAQESGYSARGAWYVSDTVQVGLSGFMGRGELYDRQVVGPFVSAGFGQNFFLLSEVDFQSEKQLGEDESMPETRAVRATYNKAGWEVDQGLVLYATLENLATNEPNRDVGYTSLGTGVQWFPRPHLEMTASIQRRTENAFDGHVGGYGTMMFHYYF